MQLPKLNMNFIDVQSRFCRFEVCLKSCVYVLKKSVIKYAKIYTVVIAKMFHVTKNICFCLYFGLGQKYFVFNHTYV